MKSIVSWLLGVFGAIAGLFAVKKHVERIAVAKERRQLNAAVKAVERQLAKTDRRIDKQAEEKIKTIRAATNDILNSTTSGSDANALIAKVKGSNR
tara:strand:- start:26371 stop:26658 length:288 start_codon:yes stop_codon:yes gene_type:complete